MGRNEPKRGDTMSTELSDIYASGVSNCCSASVIDPSGEEKEGVCADCGEHCGIESEDI